MKVWELIRTRIVLTSRTFTTDDASKFLADLNKGDIREDLQRDAYGDTYRALIKLASASSDDPHYDAALSLACAVYGWMPTILKGSKIQKLGSAFSIKKIKSIKSWEDAEIFLLEIDFFSTSKQKSSLNSQNRFCQDVSS